MNSYLIVSISGSVVKIVATRARTGEVITQKNAKFIRNAFRSGYKKAQMNKHLKQVDITFHCIRFVFTGPHGGLDDTHPALQQLSRSNGQLSPQKRQSLQVTNPKTKLVLNGRSAKTSDKRRTQQLKLKRADKARQQEGVSI